MQTLFAVNYWIFGLWDLKRKTLNRIKEVIKKVEKTGKSVYRKNSFKWA